MGDCKGIILEEEDDLESLRLAALQSIKKKETMEMSTCALPTSMEIPIAYINNGSPRCKNKRSKFTRVPGRNSRNGQFNGWSRNSNLIAVPMMKEENIEDTSTNSKLILPQDRYCKSDKHDLKLDSGSSKFDRYDNSDNSESSDSEDEGTKSPKPEELLRSNSLEALMAELENEIQGGQPLKEKEKVPKAKKKRKSTNSMEVEHENKATEMVKTDTVKENLKPEPRSQCEQPSKPPQNNFPKQRKWQNKCRRVAQNFLPTTHPISNYSVPSLIQNYPIFNSPSMNFDNSLYLIPPPAVYEPPIQPMLGLPVYDNTSSLKINIGAYTPNTICPLSPRSAAFVMENRAIVEKRKRRSYSRSPSPECFKKSPKRFSLSPKPLRQRSLSPPRQALPPKSALEKKSASVYNRLGTKSVTKPPTLSPEKESKSEEIDPVLEARRKKFERKEIVMKKGVIRLKTKLSEEEESKIEAEAPPAVIEEKTAEELEEEALLEGDDPLIIDNQLDPIFFSDEDSESDTEGRFKAKQKNALKPSTVSFNKLVNGNLENTVNGKSESIRTRSRLTSNKKSRSQRKNDKVASFTPDKKIEIKIRNSIKYEKEANKKDESDRKIEITKKVDSCEEHSSGECIEINDELSPSLSSFNEGDLRAQLSRKRAERQKHPVSDAIPSRLLQSALQGVGYKAVNKSKNNIDISEDKVPIYLRLGTTHSLDKDGKKPRKQKIMTSQEQV